MKRLLLVIQWVVVVAILWFVADLLLRGHPPPKRRADDWKQWDGFVAIAYGGITHSPDGVHIDQERLRDHLRRLADAGYETISTKDVLRFLRGQSPLPDKALYLVVEGGRKDSLLFAQPVLVDIGYRASLFLPTERIQSNDRFYLGTRQLRKVADDPHWDVNSMGHEAIRRVPVDSTGNEGFFLTSPRWDGTRGESPDEFRQRVAADYEKSRELITRYAGRKPLAYCFFPANTLGISLAPELAQIHWEEIKSRFRMAFTREGDPFNPARADPWLLTRMKVAPDWSSDRLLEELRMSEPRTRAYQAKDAAGASSAWRTARGSVRAEGAGVTVVSDGQGHGLSWLRGTQHWRNLEIEAAVVPPSNSIALVYLRYRTPQSFVRLSIQSTGIRVQEKVGARLQTLHWHQQDFPSGESERVRVRLRNNRVLVWLNGKPLGTGALPLGGSESGRIALGVSAPGRLGEVAFDDVATTPLLPWWAEANDYRSLPEGVRERASHIVVPWFLGDAAGTLGPEREAALFAAAAVGVQTFALVDLPSDGSEVDPDSIIGRIRARGGESELMALVSGVVLRAPAGGGGASPVALTRALQQKGFEVAWRAPLDTIDGWLGERAEPVADWIVLEEDVAPEDERLAKLFRRYPPSQTLFGGNREGDVVYFQGKARAS